MKHASWLLLLLAMSALSATISYYNEGLLRQPNDLQDRIYLRVTNLWPGSNVTFTPVGQGDQYINVGGTITNVSLVTNALWALYASNSIWSQYASNSIWSQYASNSIWTLYSSNAIWSTNWANSNAMWQSMTNYVGTIPAGQTNIYSTNLLDYWTMLNAGSNVWFTTNAGYLTINASNTGGTVTSGATTNPSILVPGVRTNVFYFTNGLLQAISNYAAPGPVVGATNITNGLVLYWKLNEGTGTNTYDTTSNLLTGVLLGSPIPTWVTNNGYNGGAALSFPDLAGSSYDSTTQTNLMNLTNDFSIGMWICHTNPSYGAFEGIARSGADRSYLIRWDSGRYRLYCDGIGGNILEGPNNSWTADPGTGPPWCYLVVTRSNDVFRMYTNGIMSASVTNAGSMLNNSFQTLRVGTDTDAAGRNWRGHIGEVRVHKGYALTDTDIAYLYGTYYGAMAPAGSLYVLRDGDTMTGSLIVQNNVMITNGLILFYDGTTWCGWGVDAFGLYPGCNVSFGTSWLDGNGGIYFGRGFGWTNRIDDTGRMISGGPAGGFYGNGLGLTNIDLSAITNAWWLTNGYPWTNLLVNATNIFWENVEYDMNHANLTNLDEVDAGLFLATGPGFLGNGSYLTNIYGTNLAPDSGVAILASNQTFTGINTFTNRIILQQPNQNVGLTVSNGSANYVTITNGVLRASSFLIAQALTPTGGGTYREYALVVPANAIGWSGRTFLFSTSDATLTLASNTAAPNFATAYSGMQSNWPTFRITGSSNNVSLGLNGIFYVSNGITVPSGSVTATNFLTSAVKWIDIPMNYSYSVLGPSAPALTATTNGSVIEELAFDNNDILYAQAQMQHTVATTNAAFPNWYFEPHVHFTTIGTLDSTHSNVTWKIEWEFAKINGGWTSGTNTVTVGVTNNYVHYMAELGHLTNNSVPHLSSIFRCRLTRPASASEDYSNAHDVLLDGFDIHIPIGNQNAIGSSTDNAP